MCNRVQNTPLVIALLVSSIKSLIWYDLEYPLVWNFQNPDLIPLIIKKFAPFGYLFKSTTFQNIWYKNFKKVKYCGLKLMNQDITNVGITYIDITFSTG